MMTLEELQHAKIHPVVAREAYVQADRRLVDVLDTKKSFEQKAFFLFNGYTAMALALFAVSGSVFREESISASVPFWLAACVLLAGAALFVISLMDVKYGSPGSDPDMWLNRGTIDGEDSVLPLMLAYITHHHKNRIAKSITENNRKACLIRAGIVLGLLSPIVLFVSIVCVKHPSSEGHRYPAAAVDLERVDRPVVGTQTTRRQHLKEETE